MSTGKGSAIWGQRTGLERVLMVVALVTAVGGFTGAKYIGSLMWEDVKAIIVSEAAAASSEAVKKELKRIEDNTKKMIEEQDKKREKDQQEIRQLLKGIKQQQQPAQ